MPDWIGIGITYIVLGVVAAFVLKYLLEPPAIGQRPPPRQMPPTPVPHVANFTPGPTYPRPPAPPAPPPMADMTYGCDEHYYGRCPNCKSGFRRWPGQPPGNPRGGSC